ncbi:MAG: Brp/Blh family beta-carotene 15,15'-dioxygenase [Microbacteriaceae bacterium]|nr:Brp/Blh family beta-carotene 15,15'-dioxygenase [Burkholderiaceae bacterium]
MTPVLRLQGRVFCGLAVALVIASAAGARLAPLQELLAAAALISLLGTPHGAFDAVFARKLFGVADLKGWAAFSMLYIGLSAAVVGFWFVAPTPFLCAFLVCSALHFGGDPPAGVSMFLRGLYGGAVIVLPALWHGPELQRLLGLVAGPASAAFVAPLLSWVAAPWLAATVLACALQARTSWLAASELAALAGLAVVATPLVAFTVYFCAMHSPRHVLRTLASLPGAEARHALALALWPTLGVLVALAVAAWLLSDQPIEARAMQLVFVGLAALTLPHMVLLERARRVALPARR